MKDILHVLFFKFIIIYRSSKLKNQTNIIIIKRYYKILICDDINIYLSFISPQKFHIYWF
jgi:hypothetical protein